MYTNIIFSLAKLCQTVGSIYKIPDRFQRPPKVAPGARAPLCPPLGTPLNMYAKEFSGLTFD